jgi:hypothetical protein
MRIHKGYLFWGIFFVLLGAIPLAERQGLVEADRIGDLGRYWPLALIVLGVAIVIARSGVAVVGTIVAALVLGGLAGGAIASSGGWILNVGDCATGVDPDDLERTSRTGTFTEPARVSLELDCGSITVRAGATMDALGQWVLDARHRGDPPVVVATDGSLSVRTPEDGVRRHDWQLLLPPSQVRSLGLDLNAAGATIDVRAAALEALAVQVNAGDVQVLADDATLDALSVQVNAGRARLDLGGDTDGSLQINAGALDVCVPDDAELRIQVNDDFAFVTNLDQRDLTRIGDVWTRDGSGGPTIDLRVEGNAASFNLDPAEGCA